MACACNPTRRSSTDWADRYDGEIHTRDLETDTPYNSYTRAGLPPTPIALPGAASLQATMHPADTDALYFVATGNGDGSHQFSATLAQHDVAVRAYLRQLGVPLKPSGAVHTQRRARHDAGRPIHHARGHRRRGQIDARARARERHCANAVWQVLLTREPGGSPLAERLRTLVLERGPERIAPRPRRC